jgi:hypothetical protein
MQPVTFTAAAEATGSSSGSVTGNCSSSGRNRWPRLREPATAAEAVAASVPASTRQQELGAGNEHVTEQHGVVAAAAAAEAQQHSQAQVAQGGTSARAANQKLQSVKPSVHSAEVVHSSAE